LKEIHSFTNHNMY